MRRRLAACKRGAGALRAVPAAAAVLDLGRRVALALGQGEAARGERQGEQPRGLQHLAERGRRDQWRTAAISSLRLRARSLTTPSTARSSTLLGDDHPAEPLAAAPMKRSRTRPVL
jgi:hypothetical protein